MLIALLSFLLVLGLLVFVHEAGHFVAARRAGMDVDEFGFGFPPRMFGFQKKDGRWRVVGQREVPDPKATIYSVNWIPLGGFVRIKGESGGDADDPGSFTAKPRWRRAVVLVAGVAMNFLLAMVLFTIVYGVGARQVIDQLPVGAHVRDTETTVIGVIAESAAASVGIQPGDTIEEIDGQHFASLDAVQGYIREREDQTLHVVVAREGASRAFDVQPGDLPGVDHKGLGVQLVQTGIVRFPVHFAVVQGIRTTGFVIGEIVKAFAGLFRGLIVDRAVTVDVAGPVGIAVMTGQVAQLGFVHLLQFTAILSANLGLLNIIPFPALDGGRLLLLVIEAIRRKALAKRVEQAIHAVGFAILLLLVVVVTYKDITTFGGGVWDSIRAVVGL